MTISKLIKKLQTAQKKYGDLNVRIENGKFWYDIETIYIDDAYILNEKLLVIRSDWTD